MLGAAIFKGHAPLVSMLLKKGANVSAVCFSTKSQSHKYTPLGLAVGLKFKDIADMLVGAGASLDQEFLFAHKMTTPRALAADKPEGISH
jgi:hypothetical protein